MHPACYIDTSVSTILFPFLFFSFLCWMLFNTCWDLLNCVQHLLLFSPLTDDIRLILALFSELLIHFSIFKIFSICIILSFPLLDFVEYPKNCVEHLLLLMSFHADLQHFAFYYYAQKPNLSDRRCATNSEKEKPVFL